MATKPNDPFDRAGRRKKLIEMERRHIREGEARVAVQEEIVSQLDSRAGHESEHALAAGLGDRGSTREGEPDFADKLLVGDRLAQ
jgi:hypothetical protein